MKVLITGGAGFIGSHLADAYLKRGDQVVIVDDLSSGREANIADAVKAGAKFYRLDIQSPELQALLEKEKPDLINHHAAQKSVRDSVKDPVQDAKINLIGLLNLLEAARAVHCHRIIYSSSGGAVYGEQTTFPAHEDHALRPLSPYGVSKLSSEFYLQFYSLQWGFHSVCLRYANVYGPRQDPSGEAGVVAIFLKRMIAGLSTGINGTGKQTRDYVYVSDVVAANLQAEKVLNGFQVFNIGTSSETSVLELHSLLAQESQYALKAEMRPQQPGEQARSVISSEKFQKATGWRPQFSIDQGTRKTLEWFVRAESGSK